MNFLQKEQSPTRKFAGLSLVVLLHIAIVYALVNGLARKVVEVVNGPIETKIIEELKKLPPPDKLPPPPPPKPVEPPPFVPLPEVAVAPQTVAQINTITVSADPPKAKEEPQKIQLPLVRVAAVIDAAHSCRQPEYPSASRRQEEQGAVVLKFLINENGRVVESKVERSSGYARLDEAARSALSLCQFKPGTLDGKPESSWAKLEYVWRLE